VGKGIVVLMKTGPAERRSVGAPIIKTLDD
jgi:hypothetical protein